MQGTRPSLISALCSLSLIRHFVLHTLHASLAYEPVDKLLLGSLIRLLGGHDALRGWVVDVKKREQYHALYVNSNSRISGRNLTSAALNLRLLDAFFL